MFSKIRRVWRECPPEQRKEDMQLLWVLPVMVVTFTLILVAMTPMP